MRINMKKLLYLLLPIVGLASCTQHRLAQADKAYDRMAYAQASRLYDKYLLKEQDRAATLRAADAYHRQNQLHQAAERYANAERISALQGADALRNAQVLQSLGELAEANRMTDRVLLNDPDDLLALALRSAAQERSTFFQDSSLFTVTPLELQGIASAFCAVPYREGLVFAGEKSTSTSKENPWNGMSFLDLYTTSSRDGASWSHPTALPGSVNGRFHDGPATFSADGKVMYFTRSDYYKFRLNKDGSAVSHLKLFRAEQDALGNWSDIHQFKWNGDEHSTGHAALSADGQTLYFISDMPGGLGGTDIYRSAWDGEGWGAPRNLGPTINTPGNEMFPTLHGDTLFFSSNGRAGLGGLDLFRSHYNGSEWSTPVNLNYPLNTSFDDFAFVPPGADGVGYLSSNRKGVDRIFRFTENDPTLAVTGIFLNDATDEPMADVEVKLLDLTTGEIMKVMTNSDGTYFFPLQKGHAYRVSGGKDGMFTESRDIQTAGQRISRTYREDFELKEVVIDKPIVVENIYYDYDRWDIRADAAVELDKLARVFIDNPELSFELSSHTDSRASDLYNLVLSEARANSAVDYLIRKGVNPDRITAKGYGEKRLVNRCRDGVECSEVEHQANRRTEFKVTRVSTGTP